MRERLGKPRRGSIQLSACHEAGQVIIEIIDDGQGLDTDALVRRAVDSGMVDDPQGLEDEKMNLVFLPGVPREMQPMLARPNSPWIFAPSPSNVSV